MVERPAQHGRNHRHQHSHHGSHKSHSKNVRECACGRGLACVGMTQAFRLLGDPRCYYVELPRYRKDPPSYKYMFRNNLRAAYLRHLKEVNPSLDEVETSPQRRYVALHHFHPAVVQAFYANPLTASAQKHKVPISITEHEMRELEMEVNEQDRILSITGVPTGGFYFCPNYAQDQAHDDLKTLIKGARAAKKEKSVPANIEITSSQDDQQLRKSNSASHLTLSEEHHHDYSDDEHGDQHSPHHEPEKAELSDFDRLWEEDAVLDTGSKHITESIPELEEEEGMEEAHKETATTPLSEPKAEEAESVGSPSRKSVNRDADHPWGVPKYRKNSARTEPTKRISTAAEFIDPTETTPTKEVPNEKAERSEEQEATKASSPPPQDKSIFVKKPDLSISIDAPAWDKPVADKAELALPDIAKSPPRAPVSPRKNRDGRPKLSMTPTRSTQPVVQESRSFEENRSVSSNDGAGASVTLIHSMPGSDPTLRIQVHNDLIAWESKRRTYTSQRMEINQEQWQAVRDILRESLGEVEFAVRLVLGFAKAGIIFADSIQAVYDDRLLDDAGNTVTNSFLQNRLAKRRSVQEYSIESATKDSNTESGDSTLLNSIIEGQAKIGQCFRESSEHIEQEILPELNELLEDLQSQSQKLEALGDSIVGELKRADAEVKNIWDVFDAMVTGDLMEYSVHGSVHGSMYGSVHGGSQHGGSLHSSLGPTSGSLHGFLTPRGEGVETPIVSSVHSPLVKSMFRQLGAIEDGWLVEMYYRSAVAHQRDVLGVAENEFHNLYKAVASLEEKRFMKLHQVMLAFVPRQRRLFTSLPDQMKGVLEDLVGLRIDEESLQSLIDESIRDRSHDHLKRGASHRSSIMNRSRIHKAKEAAEAEVEDIETSFGNPMKSSMVLVSKVVEIQPGGLRGIVNSSWLPALVVVTSEGGFHIFILPVSKSYGTPMEAFQALYPPMTFDTPDSWARKNEIAKSLTPSIALNLRLLSMSIAKMQNRQVQVVEEKPQSGGGGPGNRFMKAMKAAADSHRGKRCTLRLPSASEATEWVNLLERTKKMLRSGGNKGSRFMFSS